jgi:membrane protein
VASFVSALLNEKGEIVREPAKSFRFADVKPLLVGSFDEWNRHNAPRLGASLAFYTLLSLTPLLIVVVSIGGLVFDLQTAQTEIVRQVHGLIGPEGAKLIQAVLAGSRSTGHGVLATVLGLIILLFGASAVLIELRDALNTMWDLPVTTQTTLQKVMRLIRARLFSFALVLSIGFLLLVSLGLNAALAALGRLFQGVLPASGIVLYILSSFLTLIVITTVFGAIYKIIPDVRIEWRDVLLGAFVTSVLFTLGKLLIGFYLRNAKMAPLYGVATSMAVLLLWVYYSSQVFFLGAAFTKVFASRFGSQRN